MSGRSFIFAFVATTIIAFFAFVHTQPDYFIIEERIKINAKIDKIYPLISNQKKWEKWSSWIQMDPKIELSFEGDEGVGSIMSWRSENKEIGFGRQIIYDIQKNNSIKLNTVFEKPRSGVMSNEFYFYSIEDKNSTEIVWIIYGKSDFMFKLSNLFHGVEVRIYNNLRNGLQNIKFMVEEGH